MSATLELAIDLIKRVSISPEDAGCQQLIAKRLKAVGFKVEHLRFGEVDNLWARHGTEAPLFVFAGHTDVVPPGPLRAWRFPPFEPTLHEGMLYGRGAADMKGSVAAMITACEGFVTNHPDHKGSVAILLTSDEEGIAEQGTVKVIEHLQAAKEQIEWCIVGEPSSVEQLGDTVKIGRRGSLNGQLQICGIQGHVAYPRSADNPIHRCAPVLQSLCQMQWDSGNEFFPPTTFQVTNIHAGTNADNVIPGELDIMFNLRYSPEVTHTQLREKITALLEAHKLNYKLSWRHSGSPFLTTESHLLTVIQETILEICGCEPQLSTSGGTSDGRFIAPTGTQVVELGPLNGTIHKVNECVKTDDLDILSILYQYILKKLLVTSLVESSTGMQASDT
jgi:succinyl-diaminopimelate desuccinylase